MHTKQCFLARPGRPSTGNSNATLTRSSHAGPAANPLDAHYPADWIDTLIEFVKLLLATLTEEKVQCFSQEPVVGHLPEGRAQDGVREVNVAGDHDVLALPPEDPGWLHINLQQQVPRLATLPLKLLGHRTPHSGHPHGGPTSYACMMP